MSSALPDESELPDVQPVQDAIRRRLDEFADLDEAGVFAAHLVDSFLDRAPAYLAGVTNAVKRHDALALAGEAHSLSGAAGNLGATSMASVCDRLQACGRDGNLGEAPELVTDLHNAYDRVRVALHRIRATQE